MKTNKKTKLSFVKWPSLQEELCPYIGQLKGRVLNAGCGKRDITIPNATTVVNMDIEKYEHVDVIGDLETIPFLNEAFDGILNVAVLEHVRKPWKVIQEFHRVLAPDGKLLCVVPFFQPIHYVPTDYFRFTSDGIISLLEDAGFKILLCESTHTIWHTIGWMLEDLSSDCSFWKKTIFLPLRYTLRMLTKYSKKKSKTFPNAITILAKKT